MAEYIDREKLIKEIDEAMDSDGLGYSVGQTTKRYLQNQPVADVAPVVRGKWLEKEDFKTFYTCSCCNEDFSRSMEHQSKICETTAPTVARR